ncbi:MAG: LapA family protein [Rhodocyclaceae bacterium]|nr:LapA family protein [Rhodocyclaceae bacterium]
MNVMTALTWAFRLTIFALLVVFSTQNTDPVNLRLFPGAIWQVSLVTALLMFFVGGVVLGALSLLGVIFRQRHEISRLKRVESLLPVSGKQVVPHIE